MCKIWPHFDTFSSLDGRDELIPFELSQASGETKGVFWRQKNPDYFDPIPLLGGPEKNISGKKYFPNSDLIDLICTFLVAYDLSFVQQNTAGQQYQHMTY